MLDILCCAQFGKLKASLNCLCHYNMLFKKIIVPVISFFFPLFLEEEKIIFLCGAGLLSGGL